MGKSFVALPSMMLHFFPDQGKKIPPNGDQTDLIWRRIVYLI